MLYVSIELQFNLSLLQLENYNYFTFLKAKYKNYKVTFINFSFIVVLTVSSFLFNNIFIYLYFVYTLFHSFYCIYLLCKHKEIKRYIFTKKIFRFYVVFYLLLLLSISVVLVSYINDIMTLYSIYVTLNLYFVTIISFVNVLIFDIFLMKIYIKKSKNKIESNDVKIIAITGSYGKTSVKHILYEMLLKKYNVVMTPKSFNTPAGICKFVNETDFRNVDYFIVEMGAKKCGEIKELCKIFKPQYGILTSIGEQHLDTFKTLGNIFKTKCELQDNIQENGLMVFNCFNEYVKKAQTKFSGDKICVGVSSDVWYENYSFNNCVPSFDIITKNDNDSLSSGFDCGVNNLRKISVNTKLIGEHNAVNITLAFALAKRLGVEESNIVEAISNLSPIESRLEVKQIASNVTILNNGYNSNPYSARCSLKVLNEYALPKIVITPGFVEMGKRQYELNYLFGKDIAKVANNVFIVNMVNKKALTKGLIDAGFNMANVEYYNHFKDIDFSKLSNCVVLIENDLPSNYV